MQLLVQQTCEYQTNCWSCRPVWQTAQHCESSIAAGIMLAGQTMATTDITWNTPCVLLFSLFFVSSSAKPKLNSWIEELKPYNSSAKENQRASVGCKQSEALCGRPCMQNVSPVPLSWKQSSLNPGEAARWSTSTGDQSQAPPLTDQLHRGLSRSPLWPWRRGDPPTFFIKKQKPTLCTKTSYQALLFLLCRRFLFIIAQPRFITDSPSWTPVCSCECSRAPHVSTPVQPRRTEELPFTRH